MRILHLGLLQAVLSTGLISEWFSRLSRCWWVFHFSGEANSREAHEPFLQILDVVKCTKKQTYKWVNISSEECPHTKLIYFYLAYSKHVTLHFLPENEPWPHNWKQNNWKTTVALRFQCLSNVFASSLLCVWLNNTCIVYLFELLYLP